MALADGDRVLPVILADGTYAVMGTLSSPTTAGERFIILQTADGEKIAVAVSAVDTDGDRGIPALLAGGEITLVKFGGVINYSIYGYSWNPGDGAGVDETIQVYYAKGIEPPDFFNLPVKQIITSSGSVTVHPGFFLTTGGDVYKTSLTMERYPNFQPQSSSSSSSSYSLVKISDIFDRSGQFALDENGYIRDNTTTIINDELPFSKVWYGSVYGGVKFIMYGLTAGGTLYAAVIGTSGSDALNDQGQMINGTAQGRTQYDWQECDFTYEALDGTIVDIGGYVSTTYILTSAGSIYQAGLYNKNVMGYFPANFSTDGYNTWTLAQKSPRFAGIKQLRSGSFNKTFAIDADDLLLDINRGEECIGGIDVDEILDGAIITKNGDLRSFQERYTKLWNTSIRDFNLFEVVPLIDKVDRATGVNFMPTSGEPSAPRKVYMLWSYSYYADGSDLWRLQYSGSVYDEIPEWTQYGSVWYITTAYEFDGTGLDDLFIYPYFSFYMRFYGYAVNENYMVEIDAVDVDGTHDTVKISTDGGSTWSVTGRAITGDIQKFYSITYPGGTNGAGGFSGIFSSLTGHTVGDRWTMPAAPTPPELETPTLYYHFMDCSKMSTYPTASGDPNRYRYYKSYWYDPADGVDEDCYEIVLTTTYGREYGWTNMMSGFAAMCSTSNATPSKPTITLPNYHLHWNSRWICAGEPDQWEVMENWYDIYWTTFEGWRNGTSRGNWFPLGPVPSGWQAQLWYDGYVGGDYNACLVTEMTGGTVYDRDSFFPLTPDITGPSCFYVWTAYYDCYGASWYVELSSFSQSGSVQDWTDIGGGVYEKVTTTIEEPSPPALSPTCYYTWGAFYDCYSPGWSVSLYFADTSGTVSGWDCYGYPGYYAECYSTTTSSTPPSDPTYDPECV